MKVAINLRVNGDACKVLVPPHRPLVDVLRDDVGLTGTKKGCGAGECGACTVLMDGKPVNSCLVLAVQADGKDIMTIEGLAQDDRLHPIQEAFVQHGAIQCGYCSPGMILIAKALLDENPRPTELEVKQAIAGNICRCTGYVKIVEAIQAASRLVANERRA
ncbi:MAG: (2Fe-2S)-binding protein [Dehalococcoidales bacterium]|nr:(2Fe-2S)-binding protein [Dehalococcoidales bacterium]